MAGKTVLVIDADSETDKQIASTLESEGYLVFSVPGGDVGAEMAQKVSPSLIFINPDKAGLDVCRTIRRYETLKKVPIILLTSPATAVDAGGASALGLTDTIQVPFSSEELLEKTMKTLDLKAPIVLHVKEKDLLGLQDIPAETEKVAFASETGVEKISETAMPEEEMPLENRPENKKAPDYTPDYSYDGGASEKEIIQGKKKSNFMIGVAVIVIVVAGAAGFLFYSGMIPGIGPAKNAPVMTPGAAVKPATPDAAAPSNEAQEGRPGADTGAVTDDQPATSSPSSHASSAPRQDEQPTPSQHASAANVMSEKSPGKKIFSVQLGVFRSESNAAALTKQFSEKGYDAFMVKSTENDKGTLYRVLVGKSEGRAEAAKLAAKIRGKENIKAVIYSQ